MKGETSFSLFKSMIEKATDFSWLKPGDKVWDIMKMRGVRNRGFVKFVWGLEDIAVPRIPVWQPGDIYKHPAIVNYMKFNQQQDIKFTVAEVNQNPDPIAKRYMQSLIKV